MTTSVLPSAEPAATPSNLEHALRYAAEGFPVFPVYSIDEPAPAEIVAEFTAGGLKKKEAQAHARCSCGTFPCSKHSPGKHPIIDDGVNGATLEPEIITDWWTQASDANIGIRMPEGTFAIDFDFYEPGARERYDALRA